MEEEEEMSNPTGRLQFARCLVRPKQEKTPKRDFLRKKCKKGKLVGKGRGARREI